MPAHLNSTCARTAHALTADDGDARLGHRHDAKAVLDRNLAHLALLLVLVESLAHVFNTGKSANDLANPPTGHGGFATPETFHLKEVLNGPRICQVGISDLANPRGLTIV